MVLIAFFKRRLTKALTTVFLLSPLNFFLAESVTGMKIVYDKVYQLNGQETMIKRILRNGSNFLSRRQTSILSAASVVMVMIAISRLLGLVRNRVLAHFFSAEDLAVYFAAFRLPEVIFEILVFGSLSSAFIPTFTTYLSRKKKKEAWQVAALSLNLALLIFAFFAFLIFLFARPLYQILAPGFTPAQLDQTAKLARLLLLAQGFFVFSYFLTGVLESLQRFLVPALAPLFYNLSIILGTLFWAESRGIFAPTLGAVGGALIHFLIQLPLALSLGFRPKLSLNFSHPGVKEIKTLALPRIIELSALQVNKSAELFLASLVSSAAYTHFTFANSLQLLPVGLFGASLAKASLPALSRLSAKGNQQRFGQTLIACFNEIIFLVIPCSVFLAVLRIPLVRLVFGAARFTWESTVQTGQTLSAFCLSIFAQALVYLLTRAFWSTHETKTPVVVSIFSIFLNIVLGGFFILVLHWSIWSLALAFSLASIVQALILFWLLIRKFDVLMPAKIILPFCKVVLASFFSGGLMYFCLKILDRLVFDTHYAINVIFLTALVGSVGLVSYLFLTYVFGLKELTVFTKFLAKLKHPGALKAKISVEEDLNP